MHSAAAMIAVSLGIDKWLVNIECYGLYFGLVWSGQT
jgi:hypothetical protein